MIFRWKFYFRRADARFVLFPQFLERKFNDMSEEIEIKDEVLDLKVTTNMLKIRFRYSKA